MTEHARTTDAPPHADAPTRMAPRDRLAVSLLLFSAFVVILNETTMGVAVPHLMRDLDITASSAQWVSAAFMLTMAVVIPVTGFVIRRATTRATFLAAMGCSASARSSARLRRASSCSWPAAWSRPAARRS